MGPRREETDIQPSERLVAAQNESQQPRETARGSCYGPAVRRRLEFPERLPFHVDEGPRGRNGSISWRVVRHGLDVAGCVGGGSVVAVGPTVIEMTGAVAFFETVI